MSNFINLSESLRVLVQVKIHTKGLLSSGCTKFFETHRSMDGNDGLSDDGDVKKYPTLADMYKTLVGPPSGGKPPARKRPEL